MMMGVSAAQRGLQSAVAHYGQMKQAAGSGMGTLNDADNFLVFKVADSERDLEEMRTRANSILWNLDNTLSP